VTRCRRVHVRVHIQGGRVQKQAFMRPKACSLLLHRSIALLQGAGFAESNRAGLGADALLQSAITPPRCTAHMVGSHQVSPVPVDKQSGETGGEHVACRD